MPGGNLKVVMANTDLHGLLFSARHAQGCCARWRPAPPQCRGCLDTIGASRRWFWIIIRLIFSSRAQLNCKRDHKSSPAPLFLHRQRHIRHLAHLPLHGCGLPPPPPPGGDRRKRWLPQGKGATCAAPFRWKPCPR